MQEKLSCSLAFIMQNQTKLAMYNAGETFLFVGFYYAKPNKNYI
jgi:hypothetical protein